jgi:hypothetical protein
LGSRAAIEFKVQSVSTSAATGSRRRSRVSLVGLLAAALLVELALNRIGARVLQLEPLAPVGRVRPIVETAGLFAYHFTSVLAVLLAALGLSRVLVQPQIVSGVASGTGPAAGSASADVSAVAAGEPPGLFAVVSRGLVVMAMVGFIVVEALGVVTALPARLHLYLLALFTFIVLYLAGVSLRLPSVPARARVWMLLTAATLLVHGLWVAAVGLEVENASPLPRLLLSAGQAIAVTLAVVAPGCFLPPGTRLRGALAGAIFVGAMALGVASLDWSWAAGVAAYGFGLELPVALIGVGLYVVALAAWIAAVVALCLRGGTARLRGFGLLIVGLSGYQLELPYQLASTVVGLLCVVDSYSREVEGWLSPAEFVELLRRLAAWAGATEVTTVGSAGYEEARMHAARDGEPIEVGVSRRAGLLSGVEVVVGRAAASGAPPLSLLRRGTPRLGRRSGVEAPTGDARFDALFAIHDARQLHDRDPVLGDDAARTRLATTVYGWLGVWPDGVRYRTAVPTPLTSSPDRFQSLLDTLIKTRQSTGEPR